MSGNTIKNSVIITGIGQMGAVFALGFLRAGYPVYPVTRNMQLSDYPGRIPEPEFVLLAVPENNIVETIRQVPQMWRDRLGLLQNELLPYIWEAEGIVNPTAMAVWFEKKKGHTIKVFQATPVYGPKAETVCAALTARGIPCRIVADREQLTLELIKKSLYVLTINIAGLSVGGTTGELWRNHQALAIAVAQDVLTVMEHLTKSALDRDKMIEFLADILTAVPDHGCRGRVAKDRLNRVLHIARTAGLATPNLDRISE
jgi:ketopantoate reductase